MYLVGRYSVRVLGLAAFAAGLLVGAGSASAADAKKGEILFTQKYGCFQCHGTIGQGSAITSAGKVLTKTQLPYEAFSNFVRTTDRVMPPYKEAVLPNEDLQDIYAYLQSVSLGPDYKTIPLLNN
jgi:mono/diheme cytochrome c family protein